MERYYERRAIKLGSIRNCKICKIQLSRYNYDDVCVTCDEKYVYDQRQELLDMINGHSKPSQAQG